MKSCKDFENKLSLYLDNVLTAEDKRMVEEHLKSCAKCSAALADLQKVKAVTNNLSEVEPPPWFKQKVMAQVRAEAEKKSFAEKWFYPLRIKVPVQVFATIFIVVVAVYIYRASDRQFKEVMPPATTAPVMEEQKEQATQKRELSPQEVLSARESDASCEGNSCKIEGPVLYDRAEEAVVSAKGKSELPASPAPMPTADKDTATVVFKTKSPTLRASMEKSVSSVGVIQENNVVIIRTSEVQNATAQVEKVLAEYKAAKVTKLATDGKIVFKAEISKEKLKDFIQKLKTIGLVEEKIAADIGAGENMPVVIEIVKK